MSTPMELAKALLISMWRAYTRGENFESGSNKTDSCYFVNYSMYMNLTVHHFYQHKQNIDLKTAAPIGLMGSARNCSPT